MKKTITYLSVLGISLAAIVIIYLFQKSFYYQLQSYEEAVIFTLGKVNEFPESQDGFHTRLPYPFNEVVIVNTKQDRKVVIGGLSPMGAPPKTEHLVLTKDANLVTLTAEINYTIANPIHYVISMEDPDETFRDACESILKSVIGQHSISEILTENRIRIGEEVRKELQKLTTEYSLGIQVDRIQFTRVLNPFAVREAFEGVESAKQDSAISVEQSLSYRNQELPKARGEAYSVIRNAEAYASSRIALAEGEIAEFNQLYEEYKTSKNVTRKRLYLETLERTLPGIKKIILENPDKGLNMLNLGGVK